MSKVTHVFAVIGAAAAAFAMSPAGQAIAHQYPVLAPILAAVTTLYAVYRKP